MPEWLNEDAGLRVNNTCLTEKTCKCEVRRSKSIKDCTCCERVECPTAARGGHVNRQKSLPAR